MAEWLRRWTWNPMGFPRAGSNPARSELFLFFPRSVLAQRRQVVSCVYTAISINVVGWTFEAKTATENVMGDSINNVCLLFLK